MNDYYSLDYKVINDSAKIICSSHVAGRSISEIKFGWKDKYHKHYYGTDAVIFLGLPRLTVT